MVDAILALCRSSSNLYRVIALMKQISDPGKYLVYGPHAGVPNIHTTSLVDQT